MVMKPIYDGRFEPRYPCRHMVTRHCPAVYNGLCGDRRPCARYESTDPTPWLPEVDKSDHTGE
jgi:hypothetical protein